MTDTQAPAGWYPDPAGDSTKLRYWDGSQWTEQLKDAVEVAAPVAAQAVTPIQPIPQAAPDQSSAQMPNQQMPVQQPMNYMNSVDQYGNQPIYQQAPIQTKDKSGLAIASLVISIVGPFLAFLMPLLGYVCGILAIVFGVKSKNSSRKTLAIVGIVIGIVCLVITVILHAINTMYILNTYY